MVVIFQYVRQYVYNSNKKILAIVTLFTALFVFVNYHFQLDHFIREKNSFIAKITAWYGVFLLAFGFPYACYLYYRELPKPGKRILFLLLFAPLLFAIKISVGKVIPSGAGGREPALLELLLYWPVLAAGMAFVILATWYVSDHDQPPYGFSGKRIQWRPYFIMLALMIPLITAASTQTDFLQTYPKLRLLDTVVEAGKATWWQKFLFELSYGSDFFTIEFFFRGFLVIGFIKWAGKDAILPMACFYCTIHFGKPLGECISSYFGGILLGIIAFHTRSIWGGLVVHLGIAWLMELGGYLGNLLTRS